MLILIMIIIIKSVWVIVTNNKTHSYRSLGTVALGQEIIPTIYWPVFRVQLMTESLI